MRRPTASIFGCAGQKLSEDERDFFRDVDPLGFILFARNIADLQQALRLSEELRSCVARADAPVLIDQEGGRVARLRPPHWRKAPPGQVLGELYRRDPEKGLQAARLNSRLLAMDVKSVGCDVDCLPVLDLAVPDAHSVIGDRAYATTPEAVAALGRAAAEGLMQEGVTPVMKHIPGHGRATVDSHHALPQVDASRDLLERTDFLPFKLLSDLPWAMTAHVLYRSIDAQAALTVSARGVHDVVRRHIGFEGLLLSDDLNMEALGGSLGERARQAVAAGCDIALHCNGELDEMKEVARSAGTMSETAWQRFESGRAAVARAHRPASRPAVMAEFASLLPEWG